MGFELGYFAGPGSKPRGRQITRQKTKRFQTGRLDLQMEQRAGVTDRLSRH